MQSESGIVPDFEVGEEFQEEPKTYYELKSQPLKNRSVLQPKTVISPRFGLIIGVHVFQVLSRVRACARLLRRC